MRKGFGSRRLRHRFALRIQESRAESVTTQYETDGYGISHAYSQDAADRLAQELAEKYPSQLFLCRQADLSSRDSTRALVPDLLQDPRVVAKHKAVSILVANAGLGRRIRDIANIEEGDWDEMLEVNTRSPFVVTKAVLPGMRAQNWGRVILIGSIASRGGGLNGCHYAASKEL